MWLRNHPRTDSALIVARQWHEGEAVLTTKKEYACVAGTSSKLTSMRQGNTAPLNAGAKCVRVKSIQFDGYEDVYNMEVADNHNFAVNGGIIVHNCMDSTRYFVKTMGIAKNKTPYQPFIYV